MALRVFSAAIALSLGLGFAAGAGGTASTAVTMPTITAASAVTQVAIIAPLTVPQSTGGLIDSVTLADYTGPLGLLSRQLDAVAGKPVTVAIDPMILVSIRVLGGSAPASARDWLQRLSLINNEIVPLPYANADPTLASQGGQIAILAPVSFDFALNPANFAAVISPAPTATPTPSTTPSASPTDATPTSTPTSTAMPMDVGIEDLPPYPTTAQLLAWNYSLPGFLRPRPNSVVNADIAAFAQTGVTTMVLSSANVSRSSSASAVARIGAVTALISDDTASAAMDEALDSTIERDVTATETALSAAVLAAGSAQSAETAKVLITIDHSLELSSARLDTALATLTASPSISIVGLSTVAAGESSPATINEMPQSDVRLADFQQLFVAHQQENNFFSIAADPKALIAQRQLALLEVLGTVPTDNPADWTAVVDGFLAQSQDLRSSVSVVYSSNFLFLADRSFLPVSVSNDLNQAVTVFITVDPRTGLLAVGDSRVELQIEANSQAKGNIPVQSLSNGVVDVEITLTSSTGLTIGTSTVSEVNVQAGWETPVVLAFAALIVLIFSVGFIRSILRRRKPADD
ncbi:MAG: DUF6049 family protein [Rhodoglobus sp.]